MIPAVLSAAARVLSTQGARAMLSDQTMQLAQGALSHTAPQRQRPAAEDDNPFANPYSR